MENPWKMPTPDHTEAPFVVSICPSELAGHMYRDGLTSIRIVEYRGLDFPGGMKTFGGDTANGGGNDDDGLAAADEGDAELVRKNRSGESKASKKTMHSMQEHTVEAHWASGNTFRLLGNGCNIQS
jgi:hypothetical protein